MKSNQVLDTLEKSLCRIGSDNNGAMINSGGCAVFAVMLKRALDELVPGVKAEIYVLNNSGGRKYRSVRSVIVKSGKKLEMSLLNVYGVSFNHVVVKWCGKFWDSTGVYPSERMMKDMWCVSYCWKIAFEEMEGFARYGTTWNSSFNRVDSIPELVESFKKAFGVDVGFDDYWVRNGYMLKTGIGYVYSRDDEEDLLAFSPVKTIHPVFWGISDEF